jgi:hypothetical protein
MGAIRTHHYHASPPGPEELLARQAALKGRKPS